MKITMLTTVIGLLLMAVFVSVVTPVPVVTSAPVDDTAYALVAPEAPWTHRLAARADRSLVRAPAPKALRTPVTAKAAPKVVTANPAPKATTAPPAAPSGGTSGAIWAPHTAGIPGSAYTGSYYDPRFELIRRCIVRRESENQPGVVSNDGYGTAGLYQFSQSWSYTIARLLHQPSLAGVPIQTWSRYWQDAGYWAIWNHGAGASNWAGGRWSCWAAGGI